MEIPRLKNGKSYEATSRRFKARYLVIVKGMLQKDAATRVGVSEKTLCYWARDGKWNDKKFNGRKKKGGLEAMMEDFLIEVLNKEPGVYKKVQELWHEFLQDLKIEFDSR